MAQPSEHGPRADREAAAVQLAATAFVYACPAIRGYALLHDQVLSGQQEFSALFPDPEARGTRPDLAVVRHGAWLDLGAGPVVVSRPELPRGAYTGISLVDALAHPVAELGSSAGDARAGEWAVVGPTWDGTADPGVPVLRAQSEIVRLTARSLLRTPDDVPHVHALHEQIGLRRTRDARAATTSRVWPTWEESDAAGTGFATYLEAVLRLSTPRDRAERDLVGRWRDLTVTTAGPHAREHTDALIARGVALGRARIRDAADRSLVGPFTHVGGWTDEWLLARAVRALDEPFPPDPAEILPVLCPPPGADAPRGDHPRRLLLAFGDATPPPVAWSLAAYGDPPGRERAVESHGWISSGTPGLRREQDGAVSILVQHAEPTSPLARANWLRAPRGPYRVVVRLYGPSSSALRGEWIPPLLHAVD